MNRLLFATVIVGLMLNNSSAYAKKKQPFSRIDFKYTSLDYLRFTGSVISVSTDPKAVSTQIADFLRANGALITDVSQSTVKLTQTSADAECETAVLKVYAQEIVSIEANDFTIYQNIDRTMPLSCQLPKGSWIQYGFTVQPLEKDGVGYRITGNVKRPFTQQTIEEGRRLANLFGSGLAFALIPTQSTVSTTFDFSTVFEVIVWKERDQDTKIWAFAQPAVGSVFSSPGASIGRDLFSYSNGKLEAEFVQILQAYIKQKAILD